ncbi:MAG: hypothetical protein ACM3VS_16570 [Candidatus Dadabacteria bacterium]
MYTQTWNKYLPVIRILLKRALSAPQTLDLNSIDFEKGGASSKSTHKFTMTFKNGRLDHAKGLNPKGRDLATVLLQDAGIKHMFTEHEYNITLTNKFQLGINAIAPEVQTPALEAAGDNNE